MTERVIAFRLFVDWDRDGDYNEAWEDISAYLIAANGDMRLTTPESNLTAGRGMISNMSLTLRNADGRFSPLRTDGPLYAYIANGGMYYAACYLEISIDGGNNYDRVFTGVLKLPGLTTLTTRQAPTLTLTARSLEERLLQRRTSTSRTDFAAWHDAGYNEAQLIDAWLDDAGVLAGSRSIDPGLFVIPWAWLDDESPVEELWSLAGACGGRYYCDPDGIHRYENMAHWQVRARSLAVQQRYTKDDYRSLAAAYDDKDLYDTVTVETSPRLLGASFVAWEADDPIQVAAGATVVVTARFDTALYRVDLVRCKARTAGGSDVTSDITITVAYQAQRATLTIANGAAVLAYVYPVEIYGQTLTGGPTQEEIVNSVANAAFFSARGISRTRSVRGNPYIQLRAHAATLAQYIQHRHEYARETWRLADCAGQPALRLGDRIEIADNDWQEKDGAAGDGVSLTSDTTRVISAPETIDEQVDGAVLIQPGVNVTVTDSWLIQDQGVAALVTAINWRLDRTGFRQDLEAIGVANLFRHASAYFILGTDTLNGAKVTFY